MVRRSRDAKFVIYQVLYIFVITVLALKGAEINLGEVVDKNNVVDKSIRDSLIQVVDSLSKLGLKFNIEIETNVLDENENLKKELSNLNLQVASLTTKLNKNHIRNKKNESPNEIKSRKLPPPFSTKQSFLQYAVNEADNKAAYPIEIVDPLTNKTIINVPPNSKKKFELQDQNKVVIHYGNQKDEITVIKNLPPEIIIEKVTTKMDKSDIYVKDLQRTTCFTVKINDELLEQIDVNYSGPISVSGPTKSIKGEMVYNVSLKLAANEDRFNNWADKNEHLMDSDDRFKVNFFFTAIDKRSNQKVEVGEIFYFTEFSK